MILIKLDFSRKFFFLEKYSNIKFHKNPSGESQIADRRKDRHKEANSRLSQLFERA